jgi:hypothetical protein
MAYLIDLLLASLPGGRLTGLLLVVVLFSTLNYWLAPILLYKRSSIRPSRVDPAGPEQSLPESVRRHLAEQGGALAKLGFVATPVVREHDGSGNAMYHQFYRHGGTGDVAAIGIMVAESDPNPKSRTLAYSARLADGTEIKTLTDTLGLSGSPPDRSARKVMFWMGDAVKYTATVDDVVRVYRVHRAQVRRHASPQRPIPIEDPVSHQTRIIASARARMRNSGWYRDNGRGALRVTVRGACISIWRQLPPWRTIRRSQEERLAAALLAEWRPDPDAGTKAA